VIVFFVTSSDSGSLVIDTITAGGKIDAPVPQRVFWCTFEGLVAIALLIGGGLASLQAMVISTGLPFTVVLLLLCYAIWRGLRAEPTCHRGSARRNGRITMGARSPFSLDRGAPACFLLPDPKGGTAHVAAEHRKRLLQPLRL
jgi:choline-glycine betaine transporter